MRPEAIIVVVVILVLEIVLGIAPRADRLTWALENFPVWIGLIALPLTERRFPLSRLCLGLLFIHAIILMVGGFYTYARVPLGEWAKEWFGFERNHYDRLGHIAQGFIPAIFLRELLIRSARLRRSFWLPALTVASCLAFSAFYELIEWWAAIATGEGASDFLGTQGDPWDTQSDMFCALVGAVAALAFLSRKHDESMLRSLPDPVYIEER